MIEQLYEYEKNVFLQCPTWFDDETIRKVLSHEMMKNPIIEENDDNPLIKILINKTLRRNYAKYGIEDNPWGVDHISEIRYLDGRKENNTLQSFKNIIADISFPQIPKCKKRNYFLVRYKYFRYEYEKKVDITTFLDMSYRIDEDTLFVKESSYSNERVRIGDILNTLNIEFSNSFSEEQKKRIMLYVDTELPVTKEELEESIESGIVHPAIKSKMERTIGLSPIKIRRGDRYNLTEYIDNYRKNNPIIFVPDFEEYGREQIYYELGYDLNKFIECSINTDLHWYKISYRINKLIAEYLECRLKRKFHKDKFRLKTLLKGIPDQHLILSKIIIKYNEYIIKENGKEIDKQSRSKRVV